MNFEKDFEFIETKYGIEIIDYLGKCKSFKLPNFYNDKPIVRIMENVFSSNAYNIILTV